MGVFDGRFTAQSDRPVVLFLIGIVPALLGWQDPGSAFSAAMQMAALAAVMSKAFATRDYAHWLAALAKAEITFGVISRPQDVPDDQQAVACGAIVETAIPDMPRTLSNPIRLGFAEQRVAHPAPSLGQHSDEILREAGLSATDIAALKSSGAAQ